MRRSILTAALAATFALASPAAAEPHLEAGLLGALKGCEEWILNPASWAEGTGPFLTTVGLGPQMGRVQNVEEINLPPPQFRRGNHYWRINSTPEAGYVLVVSDQLPMCHITGGGNADLQPTVEAVVASSAFRDRWEQGKSSSKGEMASTQFRNREDPALTIQISRAQKPGQRLDRVQVIATATYAVGK